MSPFGTTCDGESPDYGLVCDPLVTLSYDDATCRHAEEGKMSGGVLAENRVLCAESHG